MNVTQGRPVFLNLLRIRQPVAAVVSFLHRVTGFFMVLLLPGLIYLLQLSLSSAEGFSQVVSILHHPFSRVAEIVICWMFAHHFLAGLRFLLLDYDVGISRDSARKTAWVVHFGAVVIAAIAAGTLL